MIVSLRRRQPADEGSGPSAHLVRILLIDASQHEVARGVRALLDGALDHCIPVAAREGSPRGGGGGGSGGCHGGGGSGGGGGNGDIVAAAVAAMAAAAVVVVAAAAAAVARVTSGHALEGQGGGFAGHVPGAWANSLLLCLSRRYTVAVEPF